MTDMKLTKAEREVSAMITDSANDSQYPYGLIIRLQRDEFNKLGIGLKEVGSKCVFKAVSIVTEVEKSVNDPGQRGMTLQIVDMEINQEASTNAADTLYGKG